VTAISYDMSVIFLSCRYLLIVFIEFGRATNSDMVVQTYDYLPFQWFEDVAQIPVY